MFKKNYLLVYRFFVKDKEIAGNLFYKMTPPKTQKDIELLEMQMRRDISEKYPKIELPKDIIIDNIIRL